MRTRSAARRSRSGSRRANPTARRPAALTWVRTDDAGAATQPALAWDGGSTADLVTASPTDVRRRRRANVGARDVDVPPGRRHLDPDRHRRSALTLRRRHVRRWPTDRDRRRPASDDRRQADHGRTMRRTASPHGTTRSSSSSRAGIDAAAPVARGPRYPAVGASSAPTRQRTVDGRVEIAYLSEPSERAAGRARRQLHRQQRAGFALLSSCQRSGASSTRTSSSPAPVTPVASRSIRSPRPRSRATPARATSSGRRA